MGGGGGGQGKQDTEMQLAVQLGLQAAFLDHL